MVQVLAELAEQEEGRHACCFPLGEIGGSVRDSGLDPAERSARKGEKIANFAIFDPKFLQLKIFF